MSHDRLLTASGFHGGHTAGLPLGRTQVPAFGQAPAAEPADEPAATCALGAEAESARRAREFTRLTLRDWGLACEVAELVVCELVTNSLRHGLLSARWMPGEHPIGLTILRRDPYLVCMVRDPGGKHPVRIESGAGAEGGRGLQVVESCSVRWGWEPVAGEGKVVWALLELTELWQAAGPPGRGPAAWCRSSCSPLRRAGRRTPRPWRHG